MKHQFLRLSRLFLPFVALCLVPCSASAQIMNFSFYDDGMVSSDLSTLYMVTDGSDNSSGCVHSEYGTSGSMLSPNGRSWTDFFGTSMSASFNVPFEGDFGEWRMTTSIGYYCSCQLSYQQTGSTAQFWTVPYLSHYTMTAMGNPNNTYTVDEDSRQRKCSHSTMTWNITSLSGMSDDGIHQAFGLTFVGCTGICKRGRTLPVIGPPADGPLGASACGDGEQ